MQHCRGNDRYFWGLGWMDKLRAFQGWD